MAEKNALAELAKELGVVYEVANRGCTRETCIGKVVRKAKCIVAELAKVKTIEGTYGAVAVLSETETDALFQKILAIAEEEAGCEDGNPQDGEAESDKNGRTKK